MRIRIRTVVLVTVVGAVAAAGLVILGRLTVDTGAARQRGYDAGHRAGESSGQTAGYYQALPIGEAEGRQLGRAIQEGQSLPADDQQAVQDAFKDGYAAGANDAFAGYDGGWTPGAPYLITIGLGQGDIVYRIVDRVPLDPNVDYYLCPDGHSICQQPRR
jgi:hypothetical protein